MVPGTKKQRINQSLDLQQFQGLTEAEADARRLPSSEKEQEREAKSTEMKTSGLSEDHAYYQQVMNQFEAEINALRRQL